MSRKNNIKKPKIRKARNYIAIAAFQRSGAGKHKSKKTYTRKIKHKKLCSKQ